MDVNLLMVAMEEALQEDIVQVVAEDTLEEEAAVIMVEVEAAVPITVGLTKTIRPV